MHYLLDMYYDNEPEDFEAILASQGMDFEEFCDDEEFDIDFGEESLGDIVISLERAFEQSREYNHSFEREVCFLVCHSTFHLLGYDHDTEENTKQMREKEEYILNKLNITRE